MNLGKWAILLQSVTPDGVDCHSVAPEYGNGYAVEFETGLFLYSFVRRLNPKVCAETGTHWGFSGACIALALDDAAEDYPNHQGVLFTVDQNAYDEKPEILWRKLGIDRRIYHVIADSRTVMPIPPNIDFLWLDADHRPDWFCVEFEHFFSYLNPKGAWVGLHDTRLDEGMEDGIRRVLSFPWMKQHYRDIQHVQLRNFRGLDLIQFLA